MSLPGRLPYAFARRHGLLLAGSDDAGDGVTVWLHPQAHAPALAELRRVAGCALQLQPLPAELFDQQLARVYADSVDGGDDSVLALEAGSGLEALLDELPPAADLLAAADDAPVIRLINGLIAEGARQGASDIHVEPFESMLRVRLRVDGVLRTAASLPPRLAPLLVSRIKVMARLDIAEKRVPQDGRISLRMGNQALDVRVSTLPARDGERVVLRLLAKQAGTLELAQLGLSPTVAARLQGALAQPNGIVLVTGPTGSGKTTTLYAALAALNDGQRNILTVEDPVEYAIDGIGQTPVNAKVGMSFAAGLRAILRQDPDVVMVGEIRDVETAQIAVQASLTGHLVLSTVHTNDAIGAITRLRDMGSESFLLASTLRLVLAQRLVRRLCPQCRQPCALDDPLAARLFAGQPVPPQFHAAGCAACEHTGHSGRMALYEAVAIDEPLRRLIVAEADEDQLAAQAFADGGTLLDAGRAAVAAGLTCASEVLRVARAQAGR